jgi:hypothetical protein
VDVFAKTQRILERGIALSVVGRGAKEKTRRGAKVSSVMYWAE